LPRTIADFRGRDFVLQVLEKNPPDHFLPESYTCFFLLKMPRYSCKVRTDNRLPSLTTQIMPNFFDF